MPILSALITVLHIKPQGATLHEPGFTLLATDGFLEKVDVNMEQGDKGVEVIEEFDMQLQERSSSPIRSDWAQTTMPMPPFIYVATQRP